MSLLFLTAMNPCLYPEKKDASMEAVVMAAKKIASQPLMKQIEPETKRRKILLADDDPRVLESLNQVLEEEGFEVILAQDGHQAVRQFLSESPDLLLLDLKMPGMNGWEAFSLMQKLHTLVPCILITAYPNQFERAAGMGIDALMEKPLDLQLLLETIHRFLRESVRERISRLISREFKTLNLSRDNGGPSSEGESAPSDGDPIKPLSLRRWS
jgi:DNA-binding response OmpR family regulator